MIDGSMNAHAKGNSYGLTRNQSEIAARLMESGKKKILNPVNFFYGDHDVLASNGPLERMVSSEKYFVRLVVSALVALAILSTRLEAARISAPEIQPRGGVFTSNITVTFTAAVKEIRFTLNGSTPGTNSPLYSTPIVLTNSAQIKARAFAGPAEASEITTETFVCADTNALAFTSTVPIIVISTHGNAIPSPSNAPAWMHIISPGTKQYVTLREAPEFGGYASLKLRGFSSLRYPKKSLSVEIVDATGDETPVSLLGMPADSDWILYAPYPDKTLIRDVLAYELSNKLGHYASRTRFVEVFLNDTTNKLERAHYAGVYVLEEKIKISPARVAIQKLSAKVNAEPAITGGYLFKKDHLEKVGIDLPADGPAHSKPMPLIERLPTPPGGFPAAASGFLPPADPPLLSNTLSVITNTVPVTNFLAGTNVVVPPPSVTIIRTNSQLVTNLVNVTNSVIATNLVIATNFPVATNISVTSKTVIATNPVVAMQAVAGTNIVATTNLVDAQTIVINTTVAIMTSATYRTNFVVSTNTVPLTNVTVVTNVVVTTNGVVVTNLAIASVPVVTTNKYLATNVFTLGPPPPQPGASRLVESGEGFVTVRANAFFLVDPKPAKITAAQRAWLTNYLNRFEAALYGPEYRNPTNGYPAFLDVDSFIDHHLFVEATKNIDGFRFSTFFTKDRGGKIKMEPIWDWNLSFGNARGKQGYLSEYWYWPQLNDQQYSWFRRLFEDPDFGQRYVDRWAQWRTNVFATSNVLARIDSLAASLSEPAARNFERWPLLGDTVGPEYFAGKTFADEIQNLKSWITNRFAWMDAQLVPPPAVSRATVAPPTNSITFNSPTGQIFFTTDGSDPRSSGGTVSSVARVYEAPVAVTNKVKIVARSRRDNRWSSPVAVRVE